jgi:hypothetical protein
MDSSYHFLQPPNSWVVVHNLKTCRDGAILDPDDRLIDVADDREQVLINIILFYFYLSIIIVLESNFYFCCCTNR